MDDSIIRILEEDKKAKEALENRAVTLAALNKEFTSAKEHIDQANHVTYEIESQRIDQEREEKLADLQETLNSEFEVKKAALIQQFNEKSDAWVDQLVKESLKNA